MFQRLQASEIDVVDGQLGQAGDVVLAQQSVRDERLWGDHQQVAGEGGRAGVGRITEAGWAQRQDLPERLARLAQILQEVERGWTEVADAKTARQRGGVEQDT